MITALIPTANRPEYLRTALRSVQRQSALGKVTRVIVSEHLGNRESERVCQEFKDLPIDYFFRDPLGDGKQGFALMLKEVKSEFIAVLFDDDWWGVDHIANGVRHFQTDPALSCYFAAYFMVEGEKSLLQCHSTLEFWIGASCPSLETAWKLTLKDVAAACLVNVPCTYSSIIAPRENFIRACEETVKVGNQYDTDRIITLELATQGPIIVNPIPEVFVRFHPGQDKNRLSTDEVRRYRRMSIDHLMSICRQHNVNLGKEFDQRIKMAPTPIASRICQELLDEHRDLITEGKIESLVLHDCLRHSYEGPNRKSIRKLLKQVLPPVVLDGGRKLLGRRNAR